LRLPPSDPNTRLGSEIDFVVGDEDLTGIDVKWVAGNFIPGRAFPKGDRSVASRSKSSGNGERSHGIPALLYPSASNPDLTNRVCLLLTPPRTLLGYHADSSSYTRQCSPICR
jgi:hypothetical protein